MYKLDYVDNIEYSWSAHIIINYKNFSFLWLTFLGDKRMISSEEWTDILTTVFYVES